MLHLLSTFAQNYTLSEPTVTTTTLTGDATADTALLGMFTVVYVLLSLIFAIPVVVGKWKLFQKAGQPGWAAIVPFYSTWVLLKIVGRPTWWFALYFLWIIPILGLIPLAVIAVININDLAKSYGKDAGWTLLLLFVPYVGYPLLGLSKDVKYVGPSAAPKNSGTGYATPTPAL